MSGQLYLLNLMIQFLFVFCTDATPFRNAHNFGYAIAPYWAVEAQGS
jgi:hypothetical protein